MSERPVNLLLDDMLEAIERAERYTAGMSFAIFAHDEKTIDAVVRNLEIIGEAANRLPDEFTDKHSEIEWHKVVGLRNRIIHAYFGIDLEIIWRILHSDLPALETTVKHLRS